MTELARSVAPDAATTDAATDRVLRRLTHGPAGVDVVHRPPASFVRGEGIRVSLDLEGRAGHGIAGVSLRYRHLDQSETYEQMEMDREDDRYGATIPGRYSDSPYAVQYLFVVRDPDGCAWLHPGLAADLSNQPYFAIRQRAQVGTPPT
jgi:hypothetical protein